MKIAHFESSMNWGGQELRIIEQTAWLNQNNHPTWIIARPDSKIIQQAKIRMLPLFELPLHGSAHPLTLLHLRRFLLEQKIDLLDCHGSRDSYYAAYIKWLSKIAVVRSRHITDPIKSSVLRNLIWRQGNDAVITTAQKIRDMLIQAKLAKENNIFVAPAGVDAKRFYPFIDCTLLKKNLCIPKEHLIVANVGMIRPDKGQRFFVAAARELLAQGLPITFIQIGESTAQTQDYYQEVLSLAGDELGRGIRFLGYHADIEQYLALADIVLIASISTEAQTRLVGQASMMKRALIATTVGGLPEMIEHEKTGLLCPPENISALQQAILRLFNDIDFRQKLCESAYLRAQKEMNFEYMMDEMLKVYSFAIQHSKRRLIF